MAFSVTPKLIVPDDKSANDTSDIRSSVPSTIIIPPSSATTTKKLTRMLSTQTSFDRQHAPHPIAKRFSIDADPSSVISNTPITDLSNNPLQQPSSPDVEQSSSPFNSTANRRRQLSSTRSLSLKKSDSFLEIPYEKGEIVDLIKLADDPNAAAHMINDGHEVLLEHGAIP